MSKRGNPYKLPIMMTKEMKLAFDKLVVQLETPDDFPVALRVFRAGLIAYDVLDADALQAMYRRKKLTDDEVQFLLEAGLVQDDFRPIPVERIHQAAELKALNLQFRNVMECWNELTESAKMYWVQQARKYPDLPHAEKLLAVVVP